MPNLKSSATSSRCSGDNDREVSGNSYLLLLRNGELKSHGCFDRSSVVAMKKTVICLSLIPRVLSSDEGNSNTNKL